MAVKELKEELEFFDESEKVWGLVTIKGSITPAEVIFPITRTEVTTDGILMIG